MDDADYRECAGCGRLFAPIARKGGKPQKYHSERCRRDHQNSLAKKALAHVKRQPRLIGVANRLRPLTDQEKPTFAKMRQKVIEACAAHHGACEHLPAAL